MTAGKLDGVTLRASAGLDGGALVIDYRVTNDTDDPIAILNRIFDLDASGKPASRPEMAWIDLEGDVLHVRKSMQPIPPGLQVAEKVVPWATRVDPRSSFEERMVLPLPVKVFHPHLAAALRHQGGVTRAVTASLPRKATSLKLTLGVVPVTPPLRLDPASPSDPAAMEISPPGIALQRLVELSAPVALGAPVDVLDYQRAP